MTGPFIIFSSEMVSIISIYLIHFSAHTYAQVRQKTETSLNKKNIYIISLVLAVFNLKLKSGIKY